MGSNSDWQKKPNNTCFTGPPFGAARLHFQPVLWYNITTKRRPKIATFVIADIHGEYDKFMEMLEKIRLADQDTLYILGDVVDRGPHPVKVLLKLMEMPNVVPIVGNHELMALRCLGYLREEITESSAAAWDRTMIRFLANWIQNGADPTMKEFRALSREMQSEVMEFMKDFLAYAEVEAGGRKFLLVHAGLGNFRRRRKLENYSLDELVWERPDYQRRYFENVEVVSGHTPTQLIDGNPRPGYIYRENGHIAIDCGACFPGGRLACICLETGEEYYVEG